MNNDNQIPLRIGLFFGSFNPVHNGHIGIARYLLDNGYCDKLWFVISPCNPFKVNQALLLEQDRLEMVKTAIAGDERMSACDIEFSMPKPSYTVDTLRLLSSRYPDCLFKLIIGEDNLCNFHLWKDDQWIRTHYPLLVYPRKGFECSGEEYPGISFVDAPLFPYSSTEIRDRIRSGGDISDWVPSCLRSLVIKKYEGSKKE